MGRHGVIIDGDLMSIRGIPRRNVADQRRNVLRVLRNTRSHESQQTDRKN